MPVSDRKPGFHSRRYMVYKRPIYPLHASVEVLSAILLLPDSAGKPPGSYVRMNYQIHAHRSEFPGNARKQRYPAGEKQSRCPAPLLYIIFPLPVSLHLPAKQFLPETADSVLYILLSCCHFFLFNDKDKSFFKTSLNFILHNKAITPN